MEVQKAKATVRWQVELQGENMAVGPVAQREKGATATLVGLMDSVAVELTSLKSSQSFCQDEMGQARSEPSLGR